MWLFAKKNSIVLPLECKKLILLNAMFQGGRLFVGAICVLYFLSFNLTSEDFAWIKTTQAFVFIGLDIPIGYFLNRLGEFKSLIASLIFGIIGSLGYLLFSNFSGFLFSEVFLALSLTTWPVALSAYSMKVLDSYQIDGLTEKFFHFGDSITNLFVLGCGSIGGVLYAYNKHLPYGFFLTFYLLAAMFILFFLKDLGSLSTKKRSLNFLSNIKEMVPLLPIASIIFIAQFLIQPLLHYWQPLFNELFTTNSKDMSIVFIIYSLSTSMVSWGYSYITHFALLRTSIFVLSAAIVGGLIYALIGRSTAFSISTICFSLTFSIFNLVQISAGVLIQNRLKQDNRMIITKYVSFYSRAGMILSLIVLQKLFSLGWTVSKIYQVYGLMALCAFSSYLIWMILRQKTPEKKYV
ncbi:MAG: hypothetical protein S4CHLAM123_15690 [Chlamydiales bacterium]|nr:hypothetical protein [Chlamydiales bacterium]